MPVTATKSKFLFVSDANPNRIIIKYNIKFCKKSSFSLQDKKGLNQRQEMFIFNHDFV